MNTDVHFIHFYYLFVYFLHNLPRSLSNNVHLLRYLISNKLVRLVVSFFCSVTLFLFDYIIGFFVQALYSLDCLIFPRPSHILTMHPCQSPSLLLCICFVYCINRSLREF